MLLKSRIKYIQSLGHKKSRQEAGEFLVEGPKIAAECIQSAAQDIRAVYALKPWLDDVSGILAKLEPGIVQEVDEAVLLRISQMQTPNQVLLVMAEKPPAAPPSAVDRPILVLDEIQDPGNFGTLLRTGDWFGIHTIVCAQDCADIYNPKVIQASMGSFLRCTVAYTDLEEWIDQLSGKVPVYGTVLDGKSIFEYGAMDRGLIMIGNESRGLSAGLQQRTIHRVTIPRIGAAESLNAAVAAGIVMGMLTRRL
jgi:RNA methyltransferase, TrmH family